MPDTHFAEVISIGDELLIGQVINTNQAEIARWMNEIGVSIRVMTTVGDTLEEILPAFDAAAARSSIVFVTGGLGPTHDDVTRAAVCSFLSTRPMVHGPTLAHIKELFTRRGLPLTRLNEEQALVPEGVDIVPNRLGTAAGYSFLKGTANFFVMPGVPYEMHAMMKETIIPAIAEKLTVRVVLHRTIKTTGIAESHLAERLGDTDELLLRHASLRMAYLPSPNGVRLRITGIGTSREEILAAISRAEKNIVGKAGAYVYGYDEEEMENVIGALLRERGLRLSVAESCTGGLITDRITDVPGSSDYFDRGFVCYSNPSKTQELGVPQELIDRHGAVSKEVAIAMAEGARKASGSHIAISTTGIAGPEGGTTDKPVGLVYLGYSDAEGSLALQSVFGNDRRRVKERASQAALNLLRRKLLKHDLS